MRPAPRAMMITQPFVAEYVHGLRMGYDTLAMVLHQAIAAIDSGNPEFARWLLAKELDGLQQYFTEH